MDKGNIKKIAISILIGAAIAALNTLAQGILTAIQTHQIHVIGSVTGMAYFWQSWKINQIA